MFLTLVNVSGALLRLIESRLRLANWAALQPGDVLAPLKTHNPGWADEMNNALQRALGKCNPHQNGHIVFKENRYS